MQNHHQINAEKESMSEALNLNTFQISVCIERILI